MLARAWSKVGLILCAVGLVLSSTAVPAASGELIDGFGSLLGPELSSLGLVFAGLYGLHLLGERAERREERDGWQDADVVPADGERS